MTISHRKVYSYISVLLISMACLRSSAAGAPSSIDFGGEKFAFGRRVRTATQQAVEYIRVSETPDNWTHQLAVRLLPYDQDPLDYAEAVKECVLLYNPQALASTESILDGAEARLNFQLWNPKDPSVPYELHLLRVRRRTGGLLVHEFIFRSLASGAKPLEAFHEAIKTRRPAWDAALDQADWPAPAEDASAEAGWRKAVAAIRWYIHAPHVFVERKLIEAPFSLGRRPQPPENAWLYIRPDFELDAAGVPIFIDAVRAYRATGLDLKRQPFVTNASLTLILEPNAAWPVEPGWRTLIDGLRYLNVKGTAVTDEAASTLARMKPLQVLILNDNITDAGLAAIASSLTNLVKFRPGGPKITNQGLAALKDLRKLHRLDLSDTSITGKGLNALKGLPLTEVDLGPAMGDDALEALSAIPTVRHLEMQRSPITDKGIAFLTHFANLHTLFVGPQFDDGGVQTLIRIPSLRRLDLSASRLTDQGLKALGALTDLQELGLTRTDVTDEGLRALVHMKHLRFLEVSETHVTPDGIGRLSGLPELDVVSISSKGPLMLGALKPLGNLPGLRTVIINGAPLKHEAIEYLRRHGAGAASQSWLGIALAYAEAMPPLNDDFDVARLTDKAKPYAISDIGLRRIHDVESDLDHIIPAVSNPIAETTPDTAANFLGEFTVNAAPARKRL